MRLRIFFFLFLCVQLTQWTRGLGGIIQVTQRSYCPAPSNQKLLYEKNCLETALICSKLSSLPSASRGLLSIYFLQCHRISDHLPGVHDDKRLLCIRSYFWQCLIVHIYQIAWRSHLLGSLSNTGPLREFNVSTSWGRHLTRYLFCSLFLWINRFSPNS